MLELIYMKELTGMNKNTHFIILVTILGMCLFCFTIQSKHLSAEAVPEVFSKQIAVEWNELVMGIAQAEDGLLTLKGVRTAAMMHVAMHDTLNAIESMYTTFALHSKNTPANPYLAASQAAFEIAISQYPGKQPVFLKLLKQCLDQVPESKQKTQSIELGKQAAQAILANRIHDGWNSEARYQWHPMGPGVYAEFNEHSDTPEGFIFGAGWAKAQPFILPKQSHFRSPPPPAINSKTYTNAFNEVKQLGSHESSTRTADQAHLAMWWKDFVENSHNRLARQLVQSENLDLWESTRLFALLNMSVFDAYINVFDNKFFYNHWRPFTAIRWAKNDDNPETEADENWNNLHQHTYAFPSYPSAHGTACAAAMTVLADTFGNDYPFTMTTSEVNKAGPLSEIITMTPSNRSFKGFSEAAYECSMSRVYLGIHFRYDSIEGEKLGNKVGNYIVEHAMQAL